MQYTGVRMRETTLVLYTTARTLETKTREAAYDVVSCGFGPVRSVVPNTQHFESDGSKSMQEEPVIAR